jgi:putative nucleotidyltransferase with HDIG domain
MTGQRRADAYVWGTAMAGLLLALHATTQVSLAPVIVGLLAVGVAESMSTSLRESVRVSLVNIVVLVVVIVAGPWVAVLATLGAAVPIAFQATDMRAARVAFNAGQFVFSAAAAGLVYELVAVRVPTFPSWQTLLAIALAALGYSLVNHALVAGVISLTGPDRFSDALRTMGPTLVMQVPYVGIAVLIAVVLQRASLGALLLMAVPVLIARFSLLAFQRLDESFDQMVTSIVDAIEMKDLYTRGHSERVSKLSVLVAEHLGLPYDERRLVRYAALLHDVGKVGVPLCIINKPGPLDDDEFEHIKRHPSIGAEILHDVDFLQPALDVVRYHHERLDGRGYPYGVSADELDLLVRIVTAVDAFDAMTSTRSYRRALSVADATAELRRCTGRQFDAIVVEALAEVAVTVGWTPLVEFASEAELHGHEIPVGTAQERFAGEGETLTAPAEREP